MPSEIFYSESDDGQVLVAGTDSRPKLDQTAGCSIPVLDAAPGALPEHLERVRQALCRATPEEVSAFRAATIEAGATGEDIPAEVVKLVAQRRDAVKVLTQIAADPDTRRRIGKLTQVGEIKAAVEELGKEASQESHAEYCQRRERETAARFNRLKQPWG
jgi:hypothetical protein